MRIACCLALAALGWSAAPAVAQEQRVLVVVVPAGEPFGDLRSLADAGFAVAVTSPAVDAEATVQTFLDMSQGTRVSARVYDGEAPGLRLGPRGRIRGWEAAVERADDAPGDLVPGLLGATVGRTAYVGVRGGKHSAAIVAADDAGRVDTADVGTMRTLNARIDRALSAHSLVVAEVPPRPGPVLFPYRKGLLLVTLTAPVAGRAALLRTGIVEGDPAPRLLTSRTTRRDGMVAITDFAPTIVDWLGREVPGQMQGRRIRLTSGTWEDAESLADRLAHIKPRRSPALGLAFGAWLLALAGLALAGRVRQGLRLGLLAAMWLPGVALVTGAIDPSRTVECVSLALGSLALALATDRIAGWPRAPALAAAVVLVAHAVDLIVGSPLIVRSLAGPNPAFGARFWGIGNELEAILSVVVLIGTGALLAGRAGRSVPVGFALSCALAALFMGAGRLGADVGGVITLAAGGAVAVLVSLPGGPTRRAIAIAVVTPVLAVAALAAVDVVTGGDAHLTRSVLDADSPGELVDVAERRFDISWESLKQGTTPLSVGVFALALGYGVHRRRDVLAPLEGDRAFAAGMWGTLAATVVGALANDSGPTIFLVGTAALALAAGYLAGKPLARALP